MACVFTALTYIITALSQEEYKARFPVVADYIIKELSNGHLSKIYKSVLFGTHFEFHIIIVTLSCYIT